METVYIQIFLTVVSAVVGSIVTWIGWILRKREKEREEKECEREEQLKKAEERRMIEINAVREGILAILRDRIIHTTSKCRLAGHTKVYQVENVTHMYHAYTTLGGNGMVAQIYEQFSALPVYGTDDEIPAHNEVMR